MKTFKWIPITAVAMLLAVAGCKQQPQQQEQTVVDTTPLQNSFKTAEPTTQNAAQKAIADIKSADYSGALAELKGLAANAKLTPEQQQAIKDTVAQVEQSIKDTANKVKDTANQAVKDAGKSIDKVKASLGK